MKSTVPVKQLLEQRRLVFGFIYSLVRDIDTAEEIFQDVSVSVLEETSRQSAIGQFVPWVLGVARNRVADYYRKRGRVQPLPELLAETAVAVFARNAESREESAHRIRGLLDCVEQLPLRQRQIVQFRYRDRKPVAEVATEIGWKSDAVKVALSKIRKALLDCLRNKQLIGGADVS